MRSAGPRGARKRRISQSRGARTNVVSTGNGIARAASHPISHIQFATPALPGPPGACFVLRASLSALGSRRSRLPALDLPPLEACGKDQGPSAAPAPPAPLALALALLAPTAAAAVSFWLCPVCCMVVYGVSASWSIWTSEGHGAGAVAVDGGGDAPAPPRPVGCGMWDGAAIGIGIGRLLVLIASCQQQPAGMAGVPAENPDAWGRIGLA
jgi:hypothetical protein